jgi:hypothetical protein
VIKTPTTFIIGAGASKDYGYPLGMDMLSHVRNLTPDNHIYQALHERGTSRAKLDQLNEFVPSTRRYRGDSIDSFLEDQPRFADIGHRAIALIIREHAQRVSADRQGRPLRDELDWIGYLARQMRRGAKGKDGFCANTVRFVTFNFDTVLEEELSAAMSGFYADGPGGGQLPPIVHVHGQIPELGGADKEWLDRAATTIKVIHDELKPEVVAEAREALRWAQIWCFLGFSFAEPNVATLSVNEIAKDRATRTVYGSAHGIWEGEQARVTRAFRRFRSGIELGKDTENCWEFLRRHNVLRLAG